MRKLIANKNILRSIIKTRKKLICIFIAMVILMPTITPMSYALSPFYSSSNLSDIKDKDNLVKNLIEIQRIRDNLSTLNINSNSSNNDLIEASRSINLYISELSRIRNNFEDHINRNKDSEADVFIANASIYITQCYILGLGETKFLINNLKDGKTSKINIFYSQENSIMYQYFMNGDLQLACFESFLINKPRHIHK
ncbi:MAG: hypothetical protein PUJ51_17365 [Clostridiales bacterium]|uniref:hypothetical protein n=2 Tax=Terrisporobacter sp. TaxID=1965305 RepID=UPI002A51B8CC|nr:hypothetical protein [Terrisporobacter sp.]MDD7756260.1 hypothetical protein [Clostridiales bacterium]MDY4134437.1 hypothetical protein [Terrisporobacter sp.]